MIRLLSVSAGFEDRSTFHLKKFPEMLNFLICVITVFVQ